MDALVVGNDVRGVATGIVVGELLGEASRVEGNPGDRPRPPHRLGTDTSPLVHRCGTRPEDVYVSGGSGVVTRLDEELLFTGPGVAHLRPGDTVSVSWEAAPVITVRVL